MGRCPAPCAKKINRDDYMKLVRRSRVFLRGEKRNLIDSLRDKMQRFSDEMRYEDAARIRDKIKAIEKSWQSQKVVSPELGDIDVIGFFREKNEALFKVLFIRSGLMIGAKDFFIKKAVLLSDEELLYNFFTQFYTNEIIPPSEIICSIFPEDTEAIEKWLTQRREEPVKIKYS